jgi:hypothetical protein
MKKIEWKPYYEDHVVADIDLATASRLIGRYNLEAIGRSVYGKRNVFKKDQFTPSPELDIRVVKGFAGKCKVIVPKGWALRYVEDEMRESADQHAVDILEAIDAIVAGMSVEEALGALAQRAMTLSKEYNSTFRKDPKTAGRLLHIIAKNPGLTRHHPLGSFGKRDVRTLSPKHESITERATAAAYAWAKRMNVPAREAERRWKLAEKQAKKQGMHPDKDGDRYYAYAMSIFKKMMGQDPGQNKGGRITKSIRADAKKNLPMPRVPA